MTTKRLTLILLTIIAVASCDKQKTLNLTIDKFKYSDCKTVTSDIDEPKQITKDFKDGKIKIEFDGVGNCQGDFASRIELVADTLKILYGLKGDILTDKDPTLKELKILEPVIMEKPDSIEIVETMACDCVFRFEFIISELVDEPRHLKINYWTVR